MKFKLLFIIILTPFLLSAQTRKQKRKAKVQKAKMEQYYANYLLKADSAITPYLFYQVYDWVGTRYRYSGETKKGIDCSGFVGEMYKTVYCITLTGGSADYFTRVTPIEKSDLKEGDMVFFKIKKNRISHVGIYLGNNKFAHASVRTGVIVSDLDEAYYKKYFFKGGRLLAD